MNFKAWADQLISQGRFDHAPRSERNGAAYNIKHICIIYDIDLRRFKEREYVMKT